MRNQSYIDREVIERITETEGRISNNYATFDTLIDKLEALKPYLVSVARDDSRFTTYMDVADEVGVFTARQSWVLGILGLHEDEIGNPPLPAVVVQRGSGEPTVGDKYFLMVEKRRRSRTTFRGRANADNDCGRNT
ncbi:hypothetical protein SAMN04487948_103108 [Halogranum amylolyticum]|uniref:Uncharacterized protein n=1 Tax=Halogranum amylolyticum TaxID=660520 RepID=A0A1H8QGR9_9EURY|nr:hypothetical protein [Halogranum amylolyticum]SEO53238.1 hypothetical protein SAMN04487948_103108 [Halogranum amylolyticum]